MNNNSTNAGVDALGALYTQDDSVKIEALLKIRRETFTVEIRKRKNEEYINLKRMKLLSNHDESSLDNRDTTMPERSDNSEPQNELISATFQYLKNKFVDAFNLEDIAKLLDLVRAMRMYLAVEQNAPIKEFLATGLVPYLLKLCDMEYDKYELLQLEALWVLVNLMSSEEIDISSSLVKLGVIETFYRVLKTSKSELLLEQVSSFSVAI
jgi:hypothetical protein